MQLNLNSPTFKCLTIYLVIGGKYWLMADFSEELGAGATT